MSATKKYPSRQEINAITTECDAQEQALRSRILEVRRQRNATVPVSWMPDEILETVFRAYAYDLFLHFGNPWGIVGLSHVCSSWRRVALSSSRIWYHIVLCRQKLGKVFISRSWQGPIRVCSGSSSSSSPQLNALADDGDRIDSLFLKADFQTLGEILGWLITSTKNLRILSLESTRRSLIDTEIVAPPCLKQICLRKTMLSISKCDSLTFLSISQYSASDQSASLILELLSCSHLLEEIHLSHLEVARLAGNWETKVALMNLRLFVMDAVSCAVDILANIICSPFANMHLALSSSNVLSDGISDLHFLHSADEQMIIIHSNGLTLFRNSQDATNGTNSAFSVFCSPVERMYGPSCLTSIATQASIRSLHIRSAEVQKFRNLLLPFSFITFLWISDTTIAATANIIGRLCYCLEDETPCPSLQQLKIEGVYIDDELSDKISHCFECRSANGAKLDMLELVSCHNIILPRSLCGRKL